MFFNGVYQPGYSYTMKISEFKIFLDNSYSFTEYMKD